jgi:hypothetical protein
MVLQKELDNAQSAKVVQGYLAAKVVQGYLAHEERF